jgi:hypothetical protein
VCPLLHLWPVAGGRGEVAPPIAIGDSPMNAHLPLMQKRTKLMATGRALCQAYRARLSGGSWRRCVGFCSEEWIAGERAVALSLRRVWGCWADRCQVGKISHGMSELGMVRLNLVLISVCGGGSGACRGWGAGVGTSISDS